jgi:hypothetical protein
MFAGGVVLSIIAVRLIKPYLPASVQQYLP